MLCSRTVTIRGGFIEDLYQVELTVVHKEVLVANVLGGKLNPIQCWITESKFIFCQVFVHKEGNAHAVHHM